MKGVLLYKDAEGDIGTYHRGQARTISSCW